MHADRRAWAEQGMEELGGGIYRIPLPLPGDALTAVNVYALVSPGGVDLIDSGMALVQARERLTEALARLSRERTVPRGTFKSAAASRHL